MNALWVAIGLAVVWIAIWLGTKVADWRRARRGRLSPSAGAAAFEDQRKAENQRRIHKG